MHSRRLGVVVCAVLVALLQTSCGAGGKMTTNGTPGEESERSLLENWQLFADGSPTLSMTGEEIEEAWTATAERTTHYVSLYYPVFGCIPGDYECLEEHETVEVVAERIELFETLLRLEEGEALLRFSGGVPPDIEITYAPVMEHNGIPIAELRYRYTHEHEGRTVLSDVLSYGGWLEYTTFRVGIDRDCEVGAVGCSGTNPDFVHTYINRMMTGSYFESTPTGVGSATWMGVMIGIGSPAISPPDDLLLPTPVAQPDVYLGDARITIDNLVRPEVDVSFTNIHNVTEGTKHRDITWGNLRVEDGLFRSRDFMVNFDGYILGMFSGPQHQDVGGKFHRDSIAGVFGAKRQ